MEIYKRASPSTVVDYHRERLPNELHVLAARQAVVHERGLLRGQRASVRER